jgi:hypothetical protein
MNDELANKFHHDQLTRRKERQQLYKDELDYLKSVREQQRQDRDSQERMLIE